MNVRLRSRCGQIRSCVDTKNSYRRAVASAVETVPTPARLHRPQKHSPQNFGVVLDDIGLNDSLASLTNLVVSPLAEAAFPSLGDAKGKVDLDSHHGFVVQYAPRKDKSLGFHVDDAEVTLNVCLGDVFEGGDLFFRGARCEAHQQSPPGEGERYDYKHRPGWAVLHLGRHRHGAFPIRTGSRSNLILWCRSSSYRKRRASSLREARAAGRPAESTCPPWCGMNASQQRARARAQ